MLGTYLEKKLGSWYCINLICKDPAVHTDVDANVRNKDKIIAKNRSKNHSRKSPM